MFRLKTVAFVLAAGLFVGACGGDEAGGGGAQAYASSVCQAFSTWVNDIQARNNTLTNALSPQSTPSQQKEQLGVFLDSVIQDTDKLISSVDAAGVPDVEGGERAAQTLSRVTGASPAFWTGDQSRAFNKRVQDLVLASIGLVLAAPLVLVGNWLFDWEPAPTP